MTQFRDERVFRNISLFLSFSGLIVTNLAGQFQPAVAENLAPPPVREHPAKRRHPEALQFPVTIADAVQDDRARLAAARTDFIAGRYSQAFAVAKQIRDGSLSIVPEYPDPKKEFLMAVAVKLMQAGLYSQALQVPSAFQTAPTQVEVLQVIAHEFAKVGQKHNASEVLSEALQRAKTITFIRREFERAGPEVCMSNAGVLTDLATNWAKIDQRQQAFAVLEIALEKAKTENQVAAGCSGGNDPDGVQSQLKLLSQIAKAYVQLEDQGKAREVVTIAQQAVKRHPDVLNLLRFAQLVGTYGSTQQQQQAADQLNQAVAQSNTISVPSGKIFALANLASAYTEIGQRDQAIALLSSTAQFAKTSVSSPYQQQAANLKLAYAYGQVGKPEFASQLVGNYNNFLLDLVKSNLDKGQFSQAEQMAQLIKGPFRHNDAWIQNSAWTQIALASLQAGRQAEAFSAFNRINVAMVHDEYQYTQILVELALNYAKLGQSSNVAALLAKVSADKRQPPNQDSLVLGKLAIANAAVGAKAKSAQLLVQALTVAQGSGTEVPTAELEVPYDGHPLDLMLKLLHAAAITKQDAIASQIIQAIQDKRFRVTALRQLAQDDQLAARQAQALQALAQARRLAMSITDADAKTQLLAGIAQQQND